MSYNKRLYNNIASGRLSDSNMIRHQLNLDSANGGDAELNNLIIKIIQTRDNRRLLMDKQNFDAVTDAAAQVLVEKADSIFNSR